MLSPPTEASKFALVWSGNKADVRMSPQEKEIYDQATANTDENSLRRKAHLERYFREFCENEEFYRRLNELQFKNEGKFNDGSGGKATIWAFKAWQWRVYGSIMTVKGKRCFVGVRVDPAKKQSRANQKLLKATAKIIGALVEYKR